MNLREEEAELIRYTHEYTSAQEDVDKALKNIKRILKSRGLKVGDCIVYHDCKWVVWKVIVRADSAESYAALIRYTSNDEPRLSTTYITSIIKDVQGFLGTINVDLIK